MQNHILVIDQGTTSSRVIVYDLSFNKVAVGQREFAQHYPAPGLVEHDPAEIWSSVMQSMDEALLAASSKGVSPSQIASIGITNQRETFLLWERSTGKAVTPAVVWQDRRSTNLCDRLSKTPKGKKLVRDSGLVLDPYFSGTKLSLIFKNNKKLLERAKKGELCFGTIDTFLMWRLSAGQIHATDVSNASRTLLMDLKKCSWNQSALKTLGIPLEILPKICSSNETFVYTKNLGLLNDNTPITGVVGDQQAALFGQSCLKKGQAKITYGTGAFMLVNTSKDIKKVKGALSTVAWKINNKTTYALESSVFIAGAAVQWLRDELKIINKSEEVEALANTVTNSDGVFVIPAFAGLGSPHWNPKVKGVIGGLTRGSSDAHIAKATLEGVAHSVADVFESMLTKSKIKLKSLRVDGGASLNSYLMQFQSDLLRVQVERPKDVESTAKGAAYMAALGANLLSGTKSIEASFDLHQQWKPKSIRLFDYKKQRKLWKKRVKALIDGCY